MDIKEALAACRSDPSSRFSREEVEQILADEMDKSDNDFDCDIIDLCVDVLARMENLPVPGDEAIPPFSNLVKLHNKNKRKKKRRLVFWAAVVAVEFLFAASVVSARVFNFDIVHYLVDFMTAGISVNYSDADQQSESYLPAHTDLRREMKEHGIDPVLLPDKFLEDKTISVEYQSKKTFNSANITVNKKQRDEISIFIRQFTSRDYLEEFQHNGELSECREVQVGNLSVLVMDFKDIRKVAFVDDCTRYIFNTRLDMEKAVQLAKSIQ